VVDTGRALLEQRRHHHHAQFLGHIPQFMGGGTGDGFRQVEYVRIFRLAEVRSGVQLLKQYQLGTALGRLADTLDARRQVVAAIASATLLHQSYRQVLGLRHDQAFSGTTPWGSCMVTQCRLPYW
jgi:hypothetical protein